jgi:hypothetical protein
VIFVMAAIPSLAVVPTPADQGSVAASSSITATTIAQGRSCHRLGHGCRDDQLRSPEVFLLAPKVLGK